METLFCNFALPRQALRCFRYSMDVSADTQSTAPVTLQGECQMIPSESLRSTVIPDAGGLSRAISNQGLQETATLDLWVFAWE